MRPALCSWIWSRSLTASSSFRVNGLNVWGNKRSMLVAPILANIVLILAQSPRRKAQFHGCLVKTRSRTTPRWRAAKSRRLSLLPADVSRRMRGGQAILIFGQDKLEESATSCRTCRKSWGIVPRSSG